MPLRKCLDCQHEWEGKMTSCDWCGCGSSRILMEVTAFEKMMKNLKEIVNDIKNRRSHKK